MAAIRLRKRTFIYTVHVLHDVGTGGVRNLVGKSYMKELK